MKTQTWHRILTHYLPLYFREIVCFAGNSRSDWFLALIERFRTPATITALDREAFSAAAWPLIQPLSPVLEVLRPRSRDLPVG